jgi:DNA-directed RNA polymerase subunit F
MDVVSEKPVSLSEVIALLKKRQREGELGYEQTNTLQYAEKFSKLDLREATALAKELAKMDVFTEAQLVKLVDLLPKKEEELKAIVGKDVSLGEERVKEALKLIKDYRK